MMCINGVVLADVLFAVGTILFIGGWLLVLDHIVNDRGEL